MEANRSNSFIDIILLGISLLDVTRQQALESGKSSFVSTESSQAPQVCLAPFVHFHTYLVPPLTLPQLPPLTPLDRYRISLPYHRPTSNLPEGPTVIRVPSSPRPHRPAPNRRHQHEQPAPWYFHTDPYAPPNRITLILSLCHLQQPAGNFPATAALTALLKTWTGGREVHITAHGATALAHACLTDLCHTVWRAQREGREEAVLSRAELQALERVGWDLGWVGEHIRRAGGWLAGVGR
jgi:hypothetical protein